MPVTCKGGLRAITAVGIITLSGREPIMCTLHRWRIVDIKTLRNQRTLRVKRDIIFEMFQTRMSFEK